MDVRNHPNVTSVAVSELDMNDLEVGQTVEIVCDKGTIWAVRTNSSGFHGQELGAIDMAVWGTDYVAGSPNSTRSTRKLQVGKTFYVCNADKVFEGTIEHILLPVKPKR